MPKINRIRITNFSYNSNHRHIVDEIFNFYNGENSLLSLANGGGKSVLVQTMLQPIVPRTKLLGRAISDFFIGKKDPAYIMIEWLLDDGAGFLLTGIGISSSKNYNPNADEDNLNLRFYTFSHHYEEGNKYDVKNIPVTEMKNNGVVVAGYNDIKMLIQNEENKGKFEINYYNSTKDDQMVYERRLNMYSISRNEWKELMVSINQAEHGVSEVFAKCRNSRQVMEQWVIKYIEKVLDKSTEDKMSDHQKLEEMMVQVAAAEVENEAFIQEYVEIDRFKDDLRKIDEATKDVCELLDSEDKKRKELAGIYQFFARFMKKMIVEEEQINNDLEDNKSKIKHINLEEKSYEIHLINDNIDALKYELNDLQEALDEVNTVIEKHKYDLKLQQGAREYKVLEEKRREKAEHEQLLENATKNQQQLLGEINRIEHSLKCLYLEEIELNKIEINELEDLVNNLEKHKAEIVKEVANKIKEVSEFSSEKGRLEIRKESFLKYEEKVFGDLNIAVFRNPLLDVLNEDDIKTVLSNFKVRLKKLETKKNTIKESIENDSKQVEKEKERLSSIELDISEIQKNALSNENEITHYEKVKSKVLESISKYCQDRFNLFDKEPIIRFLRDNYEEWLHKATISEMEINELIKMVSGIKGGISYLPTSLINALEENDMEVYTGEQYLRELSTSERDMIISNNPLLPYGLIVTDKEREIINDLVVEVDLSQLVPLFSHADKEKMIKTDFISLLSNPSLVRFDKEELKNHTDKIEKKIKLLRREKKAASQIAEEYINVIKQVKDFRWSIKDENELYQKKLDTSEQLQKMLYEQKEIQSSIDTLVESISKNERLQSQNENQFKKLQEDKVVFNEYLDENDKYCSNNDVLNELLAKIEKLNSEISQMNIEMENLSTAIGNQNIEKTLKAKELDEIEERLILYKRAKEDVVIEGSKSELEGRLSACNSKITNDVTNIKVRIKGIDKDIDRVIENIERLELNLADIRNIKFSIDVEKDLLGEIDRLSKKEKEYNTNYRQVDKKVSGLQGERKTKIEGLNGIAVLDKGEIYGDFDLRRDKVSKDIVNLESAKTNLTDQKSLLSNLNSRLETKLESITSIKVEKSIELTIDEKTDEKIKEMIIQFNDLIRNTSASVSGFEKLCKEIRASYNDTVSNTVNEAVKGIYSQIDNLSRNYDKYYYLTERISFYDELLISTMKLMQSKIEQLKHSKNDLIEHAYLEAKNVYDEIPKVVDNSSIEIDGVKRKILDIQYDKIQSDEIAKDRIKDHILVCLDNITNEIKNNEEEIKIRKNIIKVLSTKELLNVISNLEDFKVKAYKVDINEKNRHMMSWEDLIIKNSGGEKFVAYFSLLVALISYSRKNAQTGELFRKKEESKVLIMDNPFGPITSGHLLKPMFDIAQKYDTQLICLSDIKEAAVINSFNLVYSIKIRQNMMRQEFLDIEENNFADLKVDERLEKAYMYSQVIQMSLLDD